MKNPFPADMKNLFPADEQSQEIGESFAYFYNIIRSLRGPNGCPWDQEQTAKSLRHALLEEAYESVEAINQADAGHIKEELGDVLLIIMLIAHIEEQEQSSSVNAVIQGISAKLIRRHPHVFGDEVAKTSDEVRIQWEAIKTVKEGRQSFTLSSVPKYLPSIEQSYQLQLKAAEKGFDWQNHADVIAKIHEELQEFEVVLQSIQEEGSALHSRSEQQAENLEEELGDLLFSVINLGRKAGISPTQALTRTNSKFLQRFSFIERKMEKAGLTMHRDQVKQMEEFWIESKKMLSNED